MSGLESPEVEMDTSSTSYSSGSQGNAELDADGDRTSSTSSPSSVENNEEQNQRGGYPLHFQSCQEEQMARLYPYVEQDQLPSHWSTKEKPNFISVSEDGLKVHYKGQGKTHKDAAAVRANAPVPQSCLLYYFEVKITSKGRDGYMGIGLAASNVSTNRLPGWDKQSYGYHGDDGHSFNSSGTGTAYGPTFTTGDTIGCGYNLVEGKCFYTKNGLNLGIAFSDLPKVPLYPTVGLQTMGEELVANFGSELFMYDIEQDVIALRKTLTKNINSFPVNHGEWQPMLHSLVQSWLIHNGYCGTAQIFSESAKIPFNENVQAIKNRLKIQQLVLSGKISDAIAMTNRLYPSVLQNDPNLLFILKCRQFIEFVCCYDGDSSNGTTSTGGTNEAKMDVDGESPNGTQRPNEALTDAILTEDKSTNQPNQIEPIAGTSANSPVDNKSNNNKVLSEQNQHQTNNKRLERMIAYGKELNSFSKKLNDEFGPDEETRLMLEEAFHFVAFANPLESFLHSKLVYLDRENVCQQLNNALVSACSSSTDEASGSQTTTTTTTPAAKKKPVAIETVIKHTKELVIMNHHAGAWLFDRV